MGLVYPFPLTPEETDHFQVKKTANGHTHLVLKTYGLPYIFWGYLVAVLTVIIVMFWAAKGPLERLLDFPDAINLALYWAVVAAFVSIPLVGISFFFYEKQLHAHFQGNELKKILVRHRLFFLPIMGQKFEGKINADQLTIDQLDGSANVARLQNKEELRGFFTQAYFQLWLQTPGKKVLLDRGGRRADMEKLRALLLGQGIVS